MLTKELSLIRGDRCPNQLPNKGLGMEIDIKILKCTSEVYQKILQKKKFIGNSNNLARSYR